MVVYRLRITPADAGKTVKTHAKNICRWDHPRGCGENLSHPILSGILIGSPPRMRGKLASAMPIYPADRITPADAGKTTGQKATQWRLEDHPRGCGENTQIPSAQLVQLGSPPRMRGKRSNFSPRCIGLGITPADAGKTPYMYVSKKSPNGSPPRMRGKPMLLHVCIDRVGITPADAGKTRRFDAVVCVD